MKISIPAPPVRQHSSVWVLIIINLIPVYGVLYLGWKPFDVVFIYVIETVIIGIINVVKMAFCTSGIDSTYQTKAGAHMFKIFLIPFFIFHYFFFVAIQSLFLFIFLNGKGSGNFFEIPSSFWQLLTTNSEWAISIISILGSHLYSFLYNYIGHKEYEKIGLTRLMFQPYIRIIIQQVVAIFGIMLMAAYNTPDMFVLLLVFLKIIADAGMHLWIHRKYRS